MGFGVVRITVFAAQGLEGELLASVAYVFVFAGDSTINLVVLVVRLSARNVGILDKEPILTTHGFGLIRNLKDCDEWFLVDGPCCLDSGRIRVYADFLST